MATMNKATIKSKLESKTIKSKPSAELTDEEYSRAVEAGREIEPRAQAAHYDGAQSRLVIELQNGVALMVPTVLLQGLQNAGAKELAAVEILADGYALRWPALDADFTVPGLVQGIFGTKHWMQEIQAQGLADFMAAAGRKGGSVSTPAKQAASRANGKLGGRPRKHGGKHGKLNGKAGDRPKTKAA